MLGNTIEVRFLNTQFDHILPSALEAKMDALLREMLPEVNQT